MSARREALAIAGKGKGKGSRILYIKVLNRSTCTCTLYRQNYLYCSHGCPTPFLWYLSFGNRPFTCKAVECLKRGTYMRLKLVQFAAVSIYQAMKNTYMAPEHSSAKDTFQTVNNTCSAVLQTSVESQNFSFPAPVIVDGVFDSIPLKCLVLVFCLLCK